MCIITVYNLQVITTNYKLELITTSSLEVIDREYMCCKLSV